MVVVLVEPIQPGNVGAVARAMKNFGLTRLVVVNPAPPFDPERARWMAPGAEDVLASMRIVATLDEALEGVHHAFATTARHRGDDQPVIDPTRAARRLFDSPPGEVSAILFGREDTGLTRAQVLRCEALLRIPTEQHASLNLGQATLLLASELFAEACRRGHRPEGRLVSGHTGPRATGDLDRRHGQEPLADLATIEPAVADLLALLDRVGYTRGTGPEKVWGTLREGFGRATLTRRQVAAMRGMVSRIEYALDHPEIDWRAGRKRTAPDNEDGSR